MCSQMFVTHSLFDHCRRRRHTIRLTHWYCTYFVHRAAGLLPQDPVHKYIHMCTPLFMIHTHRWWWRVLAMWILSRSFCSFWWCSEVLLVQLVFWCALLYNVFCLFSTPSRTQRSPMTFVCCFVLPLFHSYMTNIIWYMFIRDMWSGYDFDLRLFVFDQNITNYCIITLGFDIWVK